MATTLAVVLLSALGSADSAVASSGYKFWNYFHGSDSTWQFAATGAASYIPPDGSVEGWRYGISDGVRGRQPRTIPNFEAVCAGTQPESGAKRVAVVIDFGVPREAPDDEEPPTAIGACAIVPAGFNGQQVLGAVAQVRTDAMVCGIDGYPATGCAVATGDANIRREPAVKLRIVSAIEGNREATSGVSNRLIAVVVLIVAIGLGGVALTRRRA